MSAFLRACAAAGLLTFLAGTCFALSSDSYWTRPILKARSNASGYVYGDAWNDDIGDYVHFDSTVITDDTGLVTIAPNTAPTAAYESSAEAEAGTSSTYGLVQVQGSVAFNPPGQAVAEAAILTQISLAIGAATGDFSWIEFGHSFVMEAKHKLCSDTLPNGTWKPCNCKCMVGWAWNSNASYFIDCDWVIQGYPGTPTVSSAANPGTVTVSYWDPSTESDVEVVAEGGDESGVYVDIPGWLQVGDEVTWISSGGTGGINFSPWGYTGHWGGAPAYTSGAQISALLELEVFDPDE